MLIIDFKKDWEGYVRGRLKYLGFSYNENESLESNTITFHRISRRLIPLRKRQVFIAKECIIPDNLKAGFNKFVKRIEKGEDLKYYQSRSTKKSSFNDLLLNDWGIHHFHLGNDVETDGYISRTGHLLYAMITNDSVYIIKILEHGKWTDPNLIQILHNNWKQMMKQFVASGISSENLTEKQRKTLRNKHCNTAITVSDGTTYNSPGGGIMSSGDCFFDRMNTDKIFAELDNLETIVKSNIKAFHSGAKINRNRNIEVKIHFDEDSFFLYEPNKKIRFDIHFKN